LPALYAGHALRFDFLSLGRRIISSLRRRKLMPELPEVETVRRGLAVALEGRRIRRAEARRPDLRFPLPPDFAARLTGRRVGALARRAKYLLAPLDSGETWITHLGMSGRFTIEMDGAEIRPGDFYRADPVRAAHAHILIETEHGKIVYDDPRRFGYMDLIPTAELSEHRYFKGLGPEPLGRDFHAAALAAGFAGRSQNVKASLLDQRIVAGLGNIYVCEALHRARISPKRAAGGISRNRLALLAEAVRAVLTEAIAAGGSTLRDYRGADGAPGEFQQRFAVYGREGAACPRCSGAIRRIVQAGRSTFYCRACQH
jgi:formamidopyrimidine-DNA glycosylase